jgi:putative tryptophan/tyrosine transport system substrate-binding protein
MKRSLMLFLIVVAPVAQALTAEAQQPTGNVKRIGYMGTGSVSSDRNRIDAFRQGLRDLSYVEGKNIVIEYRYAEGKPDRLPGLAAELVRLKADVIVVSGGTSARAAKNATEMVPIVMANVSDPIGIGLVGSLARPGGNITGLTTQAPELGGKRLELLKEIVPKLSRVAAVGNPDTLSYREQMKEIEIAARAMSLQVQPVEVKGPSDFENAFTAIKKGREGALITLAAPTMVFLRDRLVELAAKTGLPAAYPDSEFVESGGLMSYGATYADLYRRAAIYVDKILKGAKPADLPVEQPKKFEFIVNLKAAKQIGLTIPPNVLARADKVIK